MKLRGQTEGSSDDESSATSATSSANSVSSFGAVGKPPGRCEDRDGPDGDGGGGPQKTGGGGFQPVPGLKRSGSSSLSTACATETDDDCDESAASSASSSPDAAPPEPANSAAAAVGGMVYRAAATQMEALFTNFRSNGLPWEGYQCRSAKAGLSGAFFALPMLFCKGNRYEQAWWILQATTSVQADYFYIHTRSAWHGCDRIVAQLSVIGMVIRGMFVLQPWVIPLLLLAPIASFSLATHAKDNDQLERWHWHHLSWHIAAPLSLMIGVYLSYNCPYGTVEVDPLKGFCLPPSTSIESTAAAFGLYEQY